MNLTKYDYSPDPAHGLLGAGRQADESLSKLCPVLVGGLRAAAKKASTAKLIMSIDMGTKLALLGSILPRSLLPPSAQQDLAEAALFGEIAISELANRYRDGTLDPVYHSGDDASLEHAKKAVGIEAKALSNALNETLSAAG